jgi:imidazolonepropionase-like amidohydrolase
MRFVAILALSAVTACGGRATTTASPSATPARDTAASAAARPTGALSEPNANPFRTTYQPVASRPTLIRNATIMTAAGPRIERGSILLRDGKIEAVGASVQAPADAIVVDGTGKFVTPGLIDVHSHLGVYASPGGDALSDGNEATSPVTAHVWAEHSVWPQDPQLPRVLAGGVTTLQVLPGSANLIGGRSVVLKVVPARTVQAMKFPEAKYGL